MKRYIKMIIILIVIIFILGIIIFLIRKNNNKKLEEYQPEEEISEEQERKTMISLYYKNRNTNKIEPEVQLLDVKDLLKDPYKLLLNMLMNNPKNTNLERVIPNNTKINNVSLNNDILVIDFSNDFIQDENLGKEKEKCIINSIVNTMTELTEVNGIKILIEGEENKSFKDNEVKFDEVFIRDE